MPRLWLMGFALSTAIVAGGSSNTYANSDAIQVGSSLLPEVYATMLAAVRPEPGALAFLGAGLFAFIEMRKRRRERADLP